MRLHRIGHALSPLLSNCALEYTIRKVQANLERLKLNGTHQLVVFAKDDNLLCKNIHTAQRARMHHHLAEIKLQVPVEHTTSCLA